MGSGGRVGLRTSRAYQKTNPRDAIARDLPGRHVTADNRYLELEPYRRSNFSTMPAVSTSFCLPV